VSQSFVVASGWDGLTLTAPDKCRCVVGQPVQEMPPVASLDDVRDEVLKCASGHKRVAVLLGDMTLPAPYPRFLPELTKWLSDAGIRPSRVNFLCCPGEAGPPLGLYAVRRYGEATVGGYEVNNWRTEGDTLGDAYEAADLQLAVLPAIPEARYALPSSPPSLCLGIDVGRGVRSECVGVRVLPADWFAGRNRESVPVGDSAVDLISGGGGPSDATLEGALVSLRSFPVGRSPERSLVLVFDGSEGLGGSRFTLDMWALFAEVEEELKETGQLPSMSIPPGRTWDAVGALAAALCEYRQVILFGSGLAKHDEGEALAERLAEAPLTAKRISWVASESALWLGLEKNHGTEYAVRVDPLGWRSAAGF